MALWRFRWPGLLTLFGLVLAWVFYQGAVEAAAKSGEKMTAIVDLHRFDLLEQLRVELPQNPEEEAQLNGRLNSFFTAGGRVTECRSRSIVTLSPSEQTGEPYDPAQTNVGGF